MPTISIRNENGEIVDKEIVSRRAVIAEVEDGDELDVLLEPAVPQRIEYDHEGQMSSITTVCGETENRRESDERPKLVLEGIITEDQLDSAKSLSEGQDIRLVSDIHSGPVTVKRVTVEQNDQLIHYTPDGGERQLAFAFQLQFREPGT